MRNLENVRKYRQVPQISAREIWLFGNLTIDPLSHCLIVASLHHANHILKWSLLGRAQYGHAFVMTKDGTACASLIEVKTSHCEFLYRGIGWSTAVLPTDQTESHISALALSYLKDTAMHHPVVNELLGIRVTPVMSSCALMLWPKLFPYRQRGIVQQSVRPVVQAERRRNDRSAALLTSTAGNSPGSEHAP